MKRDFTLKLYKNLLETFIASGYNIISYEDFKLGKTANDKILILRHDVDALPEISLAKAKIEKLLGARASYYFRIVKESNHPDIIKAIAELGHEIGYHYEDLTLAEGNIATAVQNFEKNLDYFRQYYPVSTICMHGSPTSPWDNRRIWEETNYRKYDIIAEPYFDTDFESVLYITDTGRRWNGDKVSVRDKVNTNLIKSHNYRSTYDIINAIKNNKLPATVMITTHPQRWHDEYSPWIKELIFQNLKNIIKRFIFVNKSEAYTS